VRPFTTFEHRLFGYAQVPSTRQFLSQTHYTQYGSAYPGKREN